MTTARLLIVSAIAACGSPEPSRSLAASVGSAAVVNKPMLLALPLPQMEGGLQQQLSLDLAPGQHVVATHGQVERLGPGSFSWTGETEHGVVMITVHDGHVLGTIVDGNRTYRLTEPGGHVQIEPVARWPPPRLGSPYKHRDTKPPVETPSFPIEVIVAYTAAAEKVCDLSVLPQHGVTLTNTVATNTKVDARFHLAFAYKTDFVEASRGMEDIVKAFAKTNDGEMDEVHTYRTKYHADIAVLLVAPSGTGYVGMSAQTSADADTAFSVVDCTTVDTYFTMSHEIGHLLGLNDDKDRADSSTFPDGYGYAHDNADPEHSWRTVMSGGVTPSGDLCKHGCPPILYWSNPSVKYLGDATGSAGVSDDADVIRQTAGYISHFQPPPGVMP